MKKLKAGEIKDALRTVPEWKKKGSAITRTFKFDDFAGSMKFVQAVAKRAEKEDHHPDIEIHWDEVILSFTTHSQGGLTENDFKMAQACDKLA